MTNSWSNIECKQSSDTSVSKYIYTKPDAIAESVLYAYPTFEERTVMCVSTQVGCQMGCNFCGTGKFFGRDLTAEEIVNQIEIMKNKNNIDFSKVEKLQLMFMSMGEPVMNAINVSTAIRKLNHRYPNAQLLLSTAAPKTRKGWEEILKVTEEVGNVGLQFSVHESTDEARNKIMPMKAKLSLEEISLMGLAFYQRTGRKPFFNYCVHNGNSSEQDANNLRMLFDPRVWEATLSVICESDQQMTDAVNSQLDLVNSFSSEMLTLGFNTRIFNPAGQDDIGGGCGQLWQVQQFAKDNPSIMKQSVGNKIACKNV